MSMPSTDPWVPRPWRVCEVRADTGDVFSWEIRPVQGPTPDFRPGQFNMLYGFGQGEVAISICGPGRSGGLRHTVRAVGAVTRALQALPAGSIVGVRGPFGHGWPVDELKGRNVLLVAGGLGLAPLRPVMEWMPARRADFGHITLIYGARQAADLLYAEDLARWRASPDTRVLVTLDRADAGWSGHVGTVTHLIPVAGIAPATTCALVCGPEIMMRFTVLALQHEGLRTDAIHVSMERHMQCAVGYCGHCFYGPHFVCRDGPVFRFDQLHGGLAVPEL